MTEDIIYKIALGMMKGGSASLLRHIQERGVTAEDFFSLDLLSLYDALGMNSKTGIGSGVREEALDKARKEFEFVDRHNIRVLSLMDDDYPWLLSESPDAPVTLYMLGNTELNPKYSVSVVGTRRASKYGLDFCKKFCEDLCGYFPDLTIVSGLAYGIDSAAHTAALESDVATIAVMAHGLDTIYPSAHRELAKRIIGSGGALLTEYPSGTPIYQGRFLERNRIVAGMTQLTVVVESPLKGGSMSTANLAFNYNREVMALPGRISDDSSAGCNHLIRKEKAHLLTAAADVIEIMGWKPLGKTVSPRQRNLFPELEGDASVIYELLKFEAEPMAIDVIHMRTGIGVPDLMTLLTELEFDGIITRHPGNRYAIS